MTEEEILMNEQLNKLVRRALPECLNNQITYGVFCLDEDIPEEELRNS